MDVNGKLTLLVTRNPVHNSSQRWEGSFGERNDRYLGEDLIGPKELIRTYRIRGLCNPKSDLFLTIILYHQDGVNTLLLYIRIE